MYQMSIIKNYRHACIKNVKVKTKIHIPWRLYIFHLNRILFLLMILWEYIARKHKIFIIFIAQNPYINFSRRVKKRNLDFEIFLSILIYIIAWCFLDHFPIQYLIDPQRCGLGLSDLHYSFLFQSYFLTDVIYVFHKFNYHCFAASFL